MFLKTTPPERLQASLAELKSILDQFELLYLTTADQQWAMQHLAHFQFSHHIDINDYFIAAVAHRLQLPLYTHNLSDMTPLIEQRGLKPYS